MRNSHKTNKFHIRKGDTVVVTAGNSKGKKGKVLEIYPKTYRAIVEGANFVTKHLKPSANNPNGSIEKREAAIHMSNLMLVDPSTGDPTRIGRKRDDNGKLERYSKKSGEVIKNG
jgi:large subunit ribosomal protein L24